jgi:hypothetical protein
LGVADRFGGEVASEELVPFFLDERVLFAWGEEEGHADDEFLAVEMCLQNTSPLADDGEDLDLISLV